MFDRFKKRGVALGHNYKAPKLASKRKHRWDWVLISAYNRPIPMIVLGAMLGSIVGFVIEMLADATTDRDLAMVYGFSIAACAIIGAVFAAFVRSYINTRSKWKYAHRWMLVHKSIYSEWLEMMDAHHLVVGPETRSVLIGGILLLDDDDYKLLVGGDIESVRTVLDEILAKHFSRECADLRFVECDESEEPAEMFEI